MTLDSVGQSGGDEAEWEMEGEGVEGNELIEHSKSKRDCFGLCTHCSAYIRTYILYVRVHLIMHQMHAPTANTLRVYKHH